MFTIRRAARSCPTIFPKSRLSKSSTSRLRISGSRRTCSETNGLTIALHLLPAFPYLFRTATDQLSLPIVQLECQSEIGCTILWTALQCFRWNRHSHGVLSAAGIERLTVGVNFLDGAEVEVLVLYNNTARTKLARRSVTRSPAHVFSQPCILEDGKTA